MAEKNKYLLLPNLHPSLAKTLANLAGDHLFPWAEGGYCWYGTGVYFAM